MKPFDLIRWRVQIEAWEWLKLEMPSSRSDALHYIEVGRRAATALAPEA